MPGITTARSRVCAPSSSAILRRLEESWRDGRPTPLADLLPADAPPAVVCDLACAELELRLHAGQPAGPSDYFTLFPSHPAERFAVVEWDVVVRRELGHRPPPALADYVARFPDLRRELERLFGGPAGGLQFAPSELPGDVGRLGRYRVRKQVGQGGMGAVFAGLDPTLNRKVAIKVMLPEYAARPTARERFLREARAAARIRDDQVVVIYDVGEEGGVPFLAMEYLKGMSLEQYLHGRGEVGISQAVRIGRETALGLAAAHQLGVVHRDVKPGNLWLEAPRGRVKLLDFGLARLDHDAESLTREGMVVGTPEYMAPEQADGLPADPRADLFSLGAVLYRLLAGRSPFKRPTTLATLKAVAVDHPPPLADVNPDVPPGLAALVHRLLAKSPDGRFPSARAVVSAFDALGKSSPHGPPVVYLPTPMVINPPTENMWEAITTETEADAPPPDPAPPPPSRRRWLWAGGLVALALLAAAAVALTAVLAKPTATPTASDDDPAPAGDLSEPERDAVRWVLKAGGRVWVTDKFAVQVTDADQLPPGKWTLTKIDLDDCPVGPNEVARLKGVATLGSLTLTGGRVKLDRGDVVELVVALPNCRVATDLGVYGPGATRGAAQVVLLLGGKVEVGGQMVDTPAGLPPGTFTVTVVNSLENRKEFGDVAMVAVGRLTTLRTFTASGTTVTDEGMQQLANCRELKELFLANLTGKQKVTDKGVAHLRRCPLEKVHLAGSGVSDACIADLTAAGRLKELNLEGCKGITDDGLVRLAGVKTLKSLDVRNTGVTADGIAKFKAALPGCAVR